MKNNEDVIKKLTKAMEEVQTGKRFQHTLGVEFTAAALAMKHEESLFNARIAGLLHDCTKCLSDEKQIKICEKNRIPISETERRSPYLLHGKTGAFMARTEYGISDEDVLNAIINHTTGRPNMSKLEKIIFIADYIEPGRKDAPNLDEVRKMAFEDLDKAMIRILKDILDYLKDKSREIDPATNETYQFYLMNQKK